MKIATEILNQLGGNKFLAMTGAKNLLDTGHGLQFKVGGNSKKITNVKITLNSLDLYDMEFFRVSGYTCKLIATANGVYNDQLQRIFTSETGLNTTL